MKPINVIRSISILYLHFLLISIFFIMSVSTLSAAESQTPSTIEEKLAEADNLQCSSHTTEALKRYNLLLEDQDLPKEFQSLVLLRIAEAQLSSGKSDDCRKTLGRMKSIEYLPDHHRMYANELEATLDGKPGLEYGRTPVPSYSQVALSLYVSQSIGVKDSDGSREKPYPTILSALEHARNLRKSGTLSGGAIEILLLDNVYQVKQTIVLNNEDSGTERNPLVIRSTDPMNRTVLSGGCKIDTWHTEKNPTILARLPESARGRVLTASLKEHGVPQTGELTFGGFSSERAVGGSHRFKTFPVMEIFYQGTAQQMARWPNDGDTNLPLENFTDNRLSFWKDEKDLWLHGYWYWAWADAYEKVKQIDSENSRIVLEPPFNRYGFRDSKWHAVNALCEIDRPGEWHIDLDSQTIRYYPPENFDKNECVISAFGPIISATGCDYLSLMNLDVRYVRGDAMIFEECNDITVSQCSIRAASGYGLKIDGGLRCLLHTVNIEHMGRGGIDIRTGDWKNLVSSGSIIENCTISDLSRIDRTYTPAILLEGMGIKVRHCLFSNIPSSAIRMEASESLIELNEFTRCVEESDDQGAIDVWGNPLYRGNIIRWNNFHDNTGRHGMVCGIRLDDAISGFMISRNIFLRSSGGVFGGIQIHGGKDNYVDGNIMIDCQTAISNSPWGKERWKEMLTSHSGISGHLTSTPWQNPQWQKRYPALQHLLDGTPDLNYFADNHAVNCEKLYLRMSPNAVLFNNRQETIQHIPENAGDILSQTSLMNTLPVGYIGTYKH
ncbi:MAG: right-handed parallel beta-helix repeat-containing protein [Candidatus Latescibacteria bacterium]|nr:right-handed parallel beta-helix repeat-containing protein [Candidatus Latescibacterota bacterium]